MTGQAPISYTTKISANKTAAEIVAILSRHGAQMVSQQFDAGVPTSVVFVFGQRSYQFPVNVTGVLKALRQAAARGRIRPGQATPEQAQRVAWRVAKTWLEVQLTLIEAQVLSLEQVMLPHMLVAPGETVWDRYLEDGRPELTAAGGGS